MSLIKQSAKGSAVIGIGQVVSYGTSLIRNIILARMLTKADFGIAATFGIAISFLEFGGKFAFGVQIIQSKDGETTYFQNNAHFFQFIMSALGAILMFLSSGLMAQAFKIPNAVYAFQVLSLIPLMKGIEHLDVQRYIRKMDFMKSVLLDPIGQVIITIAAWPLCIIMRNYNAILILLVIKSLITLSLTHIFAERPYRWNFNKNVFQDMFHFGWPLFLNAFLTFGVLQGDRLLVSLGYTMQDLGVYSVASQITLLPSLLMMQITSGIMLPILSKKDLENDSILRIYSVGMQGICIIVTFYIIGIFFMGERVTVLLFSSKYAGISLILGLLAIASAFRVIRAGVVTLSLARGHSLNNLLSNVFRISGMVLGCVVIYFHRPIYVLVIANIIGEIVALFASSIILKYDLDIPAKININPVIVMSCFALLIIPAYIYRMNINMERSILLTAVSILVAMSMMLIYYREIRLFILEKISIRIQAIRNTTVH